MIILAHTAWLLLIPVLLFAAWRASGKRGINHAVDHTSVVLVHPDLSALAEDKPVSGNTARWQLGLNTAALGLMILALAQPQRIGDWIPETPEGREIVMLIDTSKTMSISDFELKGQPVERLTVLKGVVSRFVEARQGDHFGVIAFGSFAATLVPPTFDRELVTGMIQQIQVGVAGDNTAIGDAVGLALKQLSDNQRLRPVLILFTDGDNTAGNMSPREAVTLAAHLGVPIYTVQIGDDPFAVARDKSARKLQSEAEPGLEEIAKSTGGRYYHVGNTGALQAVVSDIGKLEQTVTRPSTRRVVEEWYLLPLLLAVGLLSIARLLQIRRLAA